MTVRPVRPRSHIIAGDERQTLLRRVLRVDTGCSRRVARIVLVDDRVRYVALTDSGGGSSGIAERDTALHLLWAVDEPNATITVEGHGPVPIAPGDTLTVSAGSAWSASAGLVVAEIGGPLAPQTSPGRIAGPTHGVERFHGYNRQTLCAITPEFVLERWKITQPLVLPGDALLINLVEPLALVWPGGTDLLGRGELRIVPPVLDHVTLLPDGLAYALVVRPHPDIAAVTEDLTPEEIAAIRL